MTLCSRCGGELPAAARFCPACGRPVDPEVGPPAPPPAPIWSGFRLPAWATADWALVGLGVALILGLLSAVSAAFGLLAAVAVAGDLATAPCGAAVGSHLAFAAFGARTAAGCGGEHGAALLLAFWPLPWALIGGWAVDGALRFAWRRLPDDRGRRIAYAGKLAVACGVALGVIAGLVATGDPSRRSSGFASSLNGGEVWFYGTVLTWFWAWIGLRRRGLRLLSSAPPDGLRRLGRLAGAGAAVFAALAAGLAVVGLGVALFVADGGHQRIGVLFGSPVVGFSFGAALVDGAMGAALEGVTGHTSLARFGLPAGAEAGAAPWLFVAVLLVPAAVAATVWRRLERERPADEQGALAVGAAIGAGFAGAAWLAALVGRIVLLASGDRLAGGWFGYAPPSPPPPSRLSGAVGTLIILRPNSAAVLGLGLMWGLGGGVAAAFLWASRHNATWQVNGAGAAAAGPPAPAEPASPAPSAWLLPETQPPAASASGPPPPSPGDGPSGPEGSGPASESRSGATAPSGSGAGSGEPADPLSSEGTVGQDAGGAGDPPEAKP